jgi:DNA polymerase
MTTDTDWNALRAEAKARFGKDSIFGEGPLDARLAIVGEAPGEQEARQGRPFVGAAGILLDELLADAGIDRAATYVTNVVKIRPTTEKAGRLSNRPPRAGEIREGVEVLSREIGLVQPVILLLLGNTPAKALIRRTFAVTADRGQRFDTELGVPAIATFHPAYLLRMRGTAGDTYETVRRQVIEDMRACAQ